MSTLKCVTVIAGLLVASCASNPARSSVTVPLEIPEPPPREAMDPVQSVIVGTPVTPERPVAAPASRPTGAPPPASAAAATPAASPPAPQAPVVVPPEPPRATPPPELRAAGTAGNPTAAQVRDRLVRTKQKLDSIDRRLLNSGKRTDYDSARRFLSQAEAAVNDNNLLLAESSVTKSETLADGLK